MEVSEIRTFVYINVESSIIATNVEDRLAKALEKATELLKVSSTQR